MKKGLFYIMFFSLNVVAQNVSLGDSLMQVGLYHKAIASYKSTNPFKNSFKIAKAYEANNQLKNANEYYKKHLEKDSLNPFVNYNYDLLLINMGKYKTAEMVFKKLVMNSPSHVNHYYYGYTLEKNNNLKDAFVEYMNACRLDPLYFKSNYKLAVLLSNTPENNKAIEITNRFLEENNENLEVLKLRAQIYFNTKKYSKAIKDFNQLIDLNQTESFILEKLAKCYLYTFKYNACIDIYTRLINEEAEEKPDYFYNRAKAYGYLNQLNKAEQDMKKAIELRSFTFENEYFYLGYFYQKEQNLKKALFFYKKTVKENKSHAEAQYQIIAIKDYRGDNESALIKAYQNHIKTFKNISTERKNHIENRISFLKQKQHIK